MESARRAPYSRDYFKPWHEPTRRPPATTSPKRLDREGWWTDAALGSMVADGLARLRDAGFAVHSRVRPWRGTMGDVDRAARAFAASFRARGVRAGDIVVFQLPNWVEAAITFWGAADIGAVVVPIVHFYGPKEVGYILRVTEARAGELAKELGEAAAAVPRLALVVSRSWRPRTDSVKDSSQL